MATVVRTGFELGRSLAYVDVEISGQWYAGEPRTWNDPGSAGYWDNVVVRVEAIRGFAEYNRESPYAFRRADRPEWFAALDRVVARAIGDLVEGELCEAENCRMGWR